MYTMTTAFNVPHYALGVELTSTLPYHERSRLFGYRSAVSFSGALLGVGALTVLYAAESRGVEAVRAAAAPIALGLGIASALIVVVAVPHLHESPVVRPLFGRSARTPFGACRGLLDNGHARLVSLIIFLQDGSKSVFALLTPYALEYVANLPSSLVPVILAAYMVAHVVGLPPWLALGRRYGKVYGWRVSLLLQSSLYFSMFCITTPLYALLPLGARVGWCAALAFVLGTATGASRFLADSVCGDVIDHDESVSGVRKDGSFFAMWLFISKSAGGFVSLLTGYALELSNFRPNVPQQSAAVKASITVLYAVLPTAGTLMAALVLRRFRLDQAALEQARAVARSKAAAAEASLL